MSERINLTEEQTKAMHKLWFVFGNGGKKSTLFNHKLIQGFVEHLEDRRSDYACVNENIEEKYGKKYALENGITDECLNEIKKILNEN